MLVATGNANKLSELSAIAAPFGIELVGPDEFAKEEITSLKEKVKSDLKELKIEHPTIEIEFEAEKCDLRDSGSLQ